MRKRLSPTAFLLDYFDFFVKSITALPLHPYMPCVQPVKNLLTCHSMLPI